MIEETCGCKKFQLDPLSDHLNTCTDHSGDKKTHDWMVDQIADLFRKTHKVKTQQVVKNRGHHCGDVELPGYLPNTEDPVPLVTVTVGTCLTSPGHTWSFTCRMMRGVMR